LACATALQIVSRATVNSDLYDMHYKTYLKKIVVSLADLAPKNNFLSGSRLTVIHLGILQ
jgi:hypothetical protein